MKLGGHLDFFLLNLVIPGLGIVGWLVGFLSCWSIQGNFQFTRRLHTRQWLLLLLLR